MSLLLLLIGGALALAILLLMVGVALSQLRGDSPGAAPPALSGDLPADVRALLDHGRRAEAIRLVRRQTALGAGAARDYVETIRAGLTPPPPPTLAAPAAPVPPSAPAGPRDAPPIEREVRALLDRRRKIEAVKLVRDRSGLGLKQAKDYVDAVEAGRSPAPPPLLAAPPPAPPADASALEAEIAPLLAAGSRIQAIKIVRERTGLGLKEARDYVEGLRARTGG